MLVLLIQLFCPLRRWIHKHCCRDVVPRGQCCLIGTPGRTGPIQVVMQIAINQTSNFAWYMISLEPLRLLLLIVFDGHGAKFIGHGIWYIYLILTHKLNKNFISVKMFIYIILTHKLNKILYLWLIRVLISYIVRKIGNVKIYFK